MIKKYHGEDITIKATVNAYTGCVTPVLTEKDLKVNAVTTRGGPIAGVRENTKHPGTIVWMARVPSQLAEQA